MMMNLTTNEIEEESEPLKMLHSLGNPHEKIERLIDDQANFTTEETGYTVKIKHGDTHTFYGFNGATNFRLYNILKAEIKSTNIDLSDIPHKPQFFKRPEYPVSFPVCYCVDFTSAYLFALKNLHFLKEEGRAFQQLTKVDKGTRLKLVGMLATQKVIKDYHLGVPLIEKLKVDDYLRGVFMAACTEIDRIMTVLNSAPGFMFYWFDGAYFKTIEQAREAVFKITEQGYPCKIETLIDFKCRRVGHFYNIKYFKEQVGPGYLKELNLPIFTNNLKF